jgi:hypothetical protein
MDTSIAVSHVKRLYDMLVMKGTKLKRWKETVNGGLKMQTKYVPCIEGLTKDHRLVSTDTSGGNRIEDIVNQTLFVQVFAEHWLKTRNSISF